MDEEDLYSHLSLLINGFDRMAVDADVIKSAIQEIDSKLEVNAQW